jgi:hypothetical protein
MADMSVRVELRRLRYFVTVAEEPTRPKIASSTNKNANR